MSKLLTLPKEYSPDFSNPKVKPTCPGDLVTKSTPNTVGGNTHWTPDGVSFDETGDYVRYVNFVTLEAQHTIFSHINALDNAGSLFQYFFSTGNLADGNANWFIREDGASNSGALTYNTGTGSSLINNFFALYNNSAIAVAADGVVGQQYVNGIRRDNDSSITAFTGGQKNLTLGSRADLNAGRMFGGEIKYVIVYGSSRVSDAAIYAISNNPYQLLKPQTPPMYFLPGAVGTTLNLVVGELALTGKALYVVENTVLDLLPGSLELTGKPLVVEEFTLVPLSPGKLELTGQTTETKGTVVTDPGELELTGKPLGLLRTTVINLIRGTLKLRGKPLSITGVAATVNRILRSVRRSVVRQVKRFTNIV